MGRNGEGEGRRRRGGTESGFVVGRTIDWGEASQGLVGRGQRGREGQRPAKEQEDVVPSPINRRSTERSGVEEEGGGRVGSEGRGEEGGGRIEDGGGERGGEGGRGRTKRVKE